MSKTVTKQAFPVTGLNCDASGALAGVFVNDAGMTLRDYFAAKAMAALIASDAFHGALYQQQYSAASDFAWGMADEMLRTREGRNDGNEEN